MSMIVIGRFLPCKIGSFVLLVLLLNDILFYKNSLGTIYFEIKKPEMLLKS